MEYLAYFLLISFGFMIGYITCGLLSRGERLDIEVMQMGIIQRDRTIRNQKLKIAEQAEVICNLKDSVSYLESPNEN